MFFDSPVLEMEHDVDEMEKSHKASEHQFWEAPTSWVTKPHKASISTDYW